MTCRSSLPGRLGMVWLLPIISLLVLQQSAAQIVFTAAPSDVLVAVGSSAQFSCQATSSNSLSIVWRKGSAVITPSARFSISLTGLTINPTQAGDEGTYTCTATDQVLQTSESRSAMLTFATIINSFLISPTGQSVSEGNSLLLFCLHSGSLPAAQITWLRDSSVLTSSNRVSITSDVLTHANPPQTTSSLSITSVLPSDSGSYTCRATNSLLPTQQVTSAAAVVTVQALPRPPAITLHPSDTFAPAAGQAATMFCTVSGQPPPTITWLHNGAQVNNDSVLITSSSTFNSTLTVLSIQSDDEGSYQCMATNSLGSAISNNATLYIAFIDESFQLAPSNTFGILGRPGLIDCAPPNSVPPAVVQWLKDSSPITDNRFTVASNGSLLISSVQNIDAGQYTCTATNQPLNIIRTSSSVQFPVYVFPNITQSPEPVTTPVGTNFTLTCVTTGTPSPVTTWLRDNVVISSTDSHIQILPNEIIITGATLNDDGVYRCQVSNPAGTVHSEVVVDIIPFPSFTITSAAVSTSVGSTVVLPCYAIPDPSFSFSWSLAGQQLSLPQSGLQLLGNGSLQLTSAAQSSEGVYTCTANNTLGSAQGTVQLIVNAPPTVTAVQNSVTAAEGQTAQLMCTVTGDPTPTVTWQSGGVTLPNAATPTITLQNSGRTLVFSPVQVANAGSYQCTANNGVGNPANATITLAVNVAPSVSVAPPSQVVVQGNDVEFSCQATGDPAPTVTWLTGSSVNVELLNNNRIEVVNGTLIIQNVTSEEEGQYMCSAVNSVGSATATVMLTVNYPPSVSLPGMFTITQGASLNLDCQPFGSPTPSVTWFKDGSSLTSSSRITVGTSVSIVGAFSSDAGTYQCHAQNSIGNATASTVLRIIVLPLISVPNPVVTANQGSVALLECNAVGNPTPAITWFKDSVPLPSTSLPHITVALNNTLIVSSVQGSDEGVYVCQATNTGGTESATVTLNVNTFPQISASQTAITVTEGNSATLSCTATGNPFPTISWLRNGVIIQPGTTGFQFLASGQTLVIGSVTESAHEGGYTCRAVNMLGSATASITLSVLVPPSFTPQPSDSIGVENSAHTLTCTATGDPTPQIQWSRNGVILSVTNTLSFQTLSRSNAGTYTCTATNLAGFVQASIQLNVYFVPAITLPPTSVSVSLSSPVSLTCVANGNPQPQYSWVHNGLSIPGATSSTYTIAMTTRNSPGVYTCQATNAVGMATANATLTVIFPPSPPNITSITVLSSSSISFVWSAPLDDGGSPVTAYLIEYRPHANQSAAYTTTTLPATQLVHTLNNLLPYTEYDIKVGGVNIAGTGNRSGALEPPPRTHADYPVAPGNLRIVSSTSSSLTLTWDTPSPLNGPLGVYQLRYTIDQSDESAATILFVDTFTIDSIQADRTYHFSVRAATMGQTGEALWGPYSNDIWVRNGVEIGEPTLPPPSSSAVAFVATSTPIILAAPSSTPQPVAMSTAIPSSSSFVVSVASSVPVPSSIPVPIPSSTLIPSSTPLFSPTPSVVLFPPTVAASGLQLFTPTSGQIIAVWQTPLTGAGTFDGYHVYISPPVPSLSLPLTIPLNTPTSVIFNMLDDFTEYTVSVATFNNDGDGPATSATVTTHEGVPSSPVGVSVQVQQGADSILVSWQPPLMPNGVITQYAISTLNTATSEQVTTFVMPATPINSTQSSIIGNLSPQSSYQVTVTAQTQVGTGPPSQAVTVVLVEPSSSVSSMAESSTPLLVSTPADVAAPSSTSIITPPPTAVTASSVTMATTTKTSSTTVSSTENFTASLIDMLEESSSELIVMLTLTDDSAQEVPLPPTVTLSPSQSMTNVTATELGAGFYAGIIVAVVAVVFVLVVTTLVIATIIQRRSNNKKWTGTYNISPSATAELNALELEPAPLIVPDVDDDDDDGGSENPYADEPGGQGFTLAPGTSDQQHYPDSDLEQRDAAEEPDEIDDIQPSPLPGRPSFNSGDRSLDELNRTRAHKAKRRGERMRVVPDHDDLVPLDPGNMPETKIGGMGTSPEDYTGDGAADMY